MNIWNSDKKALDKNGDNILQYILLKGETNNIGANVRTDYVLSYKASLIASETNIVPDTLLKIF